MVKGSAVARGPMYNASEDKTDDERAGSGADRVSTRRTVKIGNSPIAMPIAMLQAQGDRIQVGETV